MARMSLLKKFTLSTAAIVIVLGAAAPAYAGGHRHHHYRHHHHKGGGKGAAIALGVIGGAIILNELAEERARDRYYEDRYYRDWYYEQRARDRAYEQGYYDGQADARRYGAGDEADAYYEGGGAYDDSDLAGGDPVPLGGPVYETPGGADYDRAPRLVSARAAYQTCLDHARQALGARGFVISAPYRPETVEDRGGAVLMTATVTAQRGGESWARAMSCEASESRVYRMELI